MVLCSHWLLATCFFVEQHVSSVVLGYFIPTGRFSLFLPRGAYVLWVSFSHLEFSLRLFAVRSRHEFKRGQNWVDHFLPIVYVSPSGPLFVGRCRSRFFRAPSKWNPRRCTLYRSCVLSFSPLFFFVIVPTSQPWNVSKHARCLRQSCQGLPRFLSDRE